jgi:hypothetical protein
MPCGGVPHAIAFAFRKAGRGAKESLSARRGTIVGEIAYAAVHERDLTLRIAQDRDPPEDSPIQRDTHARATVRMG